MVAGQSLGQPFILRGGSGKELFLCSGLHHPIAHPHSLSGYLISLEGWSQVIGFMETQLRREIVSKIPRRVDGWADSKRNPDQPVDPLFCLARVPDERKIIYCGGDGNRFTKQDDSGTPRASHIAVEMQRQSCDGPGLRGSGRSQQRSARLLGPPARSAPRLQPCECRFLVWRVATLGECAHPDRRQPGI